jgi:soluble lytic murein transglycosylase
MALDVPRERARAESWLRETFALPEDADLAGLGELAADPAMLRGAELWRLGMLAEARDEFEGMRTRFENDPVSLYRLMNYFQELGVYRSAVFAARQILTLAGLSDADTLSAPAYFNHNRFPTPFAEMILPLAEEHDFHPLFVWSVVRQESLFESFVRSSAAAHGLMQVIPATGADLAANLGWPKDYANEDLYRPLVSLTFGTEYLERQRRAFGGDLYAALAAYNGGPGNSRAWLNLANGDQDLFLETIRYGETRNYIRGIYEIFNLYRRIYGHTP